MCQLQADVGIEVVGRNGMTRTASAISVPATKRPETRRPMADRSAKLRKDRFSERWTKSALSMKYLPEPEG
jgi:hypothetical protein